jgi:hypothetical protein
MGRDRVPDGVFGIGRRCNPVEYIIRKELNEFCAVLSGRVREICRVNGFDRPRPLSV